MTLAPNSAMPRDPEDFWSRAARELGGSPESLWARRLVAQASGLLPSVSTGPTGATARWLRDSVLHAGADTARMGAMVGAPVMDRMAHAAYPDLYRWPDGEVRPPATMADVTELIPTDPQRAADADAAGREIGPLGMVLASLAMMKGPGGPGSKDPRFKMQSPPKIGGARSAPAVTRTPVEAAREIINRWAQRSRDWSSGRDPRWAGNRATLELNPEPVQAIQQRMIHGWNAGQEMRARGLRVPLVLGKDPKGPFYAGVGHGLMDQPRPEGEPVWQHPVYTERLRSLAPQSSLDDLLKPKLSFVPYAHRADMEQELSSQGHTGVTTAIPIYWERAPEDAAGRYRPTWASRSALARDPGPLRTPEELYRWSAVPAHELIHRFQLVREAPMGSVGNVFLPDTWGEALRNIESTPGFSTAARDRIRALLTQYAGAARLTPNWADFEAPHLRFESEATRNAYSELLNHLEGLNSDLEQRIGRLAPTRELSDTQLALQRQLEQTRYLVRRSDYLADPREAQAYVGSGVVLNPKAKERPGVRDVWSHLREMVNDDPQLNQRFRLLGLGGLAAGAAAAGAADPANPIPAYPMWVTTPPDQRE